MGWFIKGWVGHSPHLQVVRLELLYSMSTAKRNVLLGKRAVELVSGGQQRKIVKNCKVGIKAYKFLWSGSAF